MKNRLLFATLLIAAQVALPATASAQWRYGTPSHERREVIHYYSVHPMVYPPRIAPPRWSVGMHLSGISANHAVRDEGLTLAGIGCHLRFRNYRFGAELAIDVLGNTFAEGGISRVSMPIQASGMLYVLPHGPFNLYLLAGLRLVPSHVSWQLPDLTADQTFTEFGAQVGVGAELLLSRHFALTGDLRGFGTVRNDSEASGAYYRRLDDHEQATPVPGTTAGLQLSLGASLRF